MVSPEEIGTATFERTMRGYRCEDVNEYLQQIAQAMMDREAELADTKNKILILAQKVEEYRKEEDTLKTAMINAQRMGESVIKEAKQKAEEIIREANIRAEDREQHSREEVARAQEELERLQSEVTQFRNTVLGLYKEHINSLGKLPIQSEEPAASTFEESEESPATEPEIHNTQEFDVDEAEETDASHFRDLFDADSYDEVDTDAEPAPAEDDDEDNAEPQHEDYDIPPALDSFKGISFGD